MATTIQHTIRRLLCAAFSIDEMKTLVSDLGEDHESVIPANANKDAAAREVAKWAFRFGKDDDLLSEIEKRNPKRYEEFKGEIEKLKEAKLPLERARGVEEMVGEEMESLKSAKISASPSPGKKPASNKHPLSGSPAQVKSYFESLSDEQKTFLVVASLFNGLQREEMMSVYREALSTLNLSAQNGGDGS